MRTLTVVLGVAVATASAGLWPAQAVDLSRQEPIQLALQHGDQHDNHIFEPSTFDLETGRLYKLVLSNPSPSKHYFSSPGFAAAIWTRKVQTDQGEIKGSVREIQLNPGGKVEWWFVPVQAGTFELICTVDGHAEAGMVGLITVE